jgi:hypothetical protein
MASAVAVMKNTTGMFEVTRKTGVVDVTSPLHVRRGKALDDCG